MRTFFSFLCGILLFISCEKAVLPKPKNLIESAKMEQIIYDMTLLEAIKSQVSMDKNKFTGKTKDYIFKKYKIDSLLFVKSNQYYAAADIIEYRKMFERVKEKLVAENKKVGVVESKTDVGVVK